MEWRRDPYRVSDRTEELDLAAVHGYLQRSYWAARIPLETVRRSLAGSLVFGLYRSEGSDVRQVGFARVISDRATFAYLCDVFVLEEERGRGLGRFLVECVHDHPELQGLRRWMLVTRDAHGLYAPLGWGPVPEPESVMQILRPNPYP